MSGVKQPRREIRLFDFEIRDTKDVCGEENKYANYLEIIMFGLDEFRQTYAVKINDFKPFFYIKIDGFDEDEDDITLFRDALKKYFTDACNLIDIKSYTTKKNEMIENIYEKINELGYEETEENDAKINKLEEIIEGHKQDIKDYKSVFYDDMFDEFEIEYHKTLYGFDNGKKYPFIKMSFQSNHLMYMIKNDNWYDLVPDKTSNTGRSYKLKDRVHMFRKFYNEYPDWRNVSLKLYETKLPPLLRFFHVRQISPSGWVRLNTKHDFMHKSNRNHRRVMFSTCDFEIDLSNENIEPIPEKENLVPYKICSFDIEASSSHGDFPLAKKGYQKVLAEMINYIQKHSDEFKKKTFVDKCEVFRDMLLSAFRLQNRKAFYPCMSILYPKDIKKGVNFEKLVNRNIDNLLSTTTHLFLEEKTQKKTKYDEEIKEKMGDKYVEEDLSVYMEDDDDAPKKEKWHPPLPKNLMYVSDLTHQSTKGKKITIEQYSNILKSKDDAKISEVNLHYYKPGNCGVKYHQLNLVHALFYEMDNRKKLLILGRALESNYEKNIANPLPQIKGDEVTFIGSTFIRYGESKPYRNHCLMQNKCSVDDTLGYDMVDNLSEEDVLVKWTELIIQEDPDIIIGYNIFGFDWKFMVERARELDKKNFGGGKQYKNTGNKVMDRFLKLSRLSGNYKCKVKQKSMKLADGSHELEYVEIPGRVQIDLYNYFRRELNLPSYKLNFVSGYFIGDGVKKIETVGDGDECKIIVYSKNLMGLSNGNNVSFEILGHTTELYRDGAKYEVSEVDEAGGCFAICGVGEGEFDGLMSGGSKVRWCMGKDDVSPHDIFAMTNGTDEERGKVAKYCIQDCNLVQNLFRKNDVLTGMIEIAGICSVPIDFIVMRGQGIKLLSFVGKKCSEQNVLMKSLEKTSSTESYEGAICLPPTTDVYTDHPVAVNDYSSLYPSSMISENISHDSKVWAKEYDLGGKLLSKEGDDEYDNLEEEGFKYVDIKFDTYEWIAPPGKKKRKKLRSAIVYVVSHNFLKMKMVRNSMVLCPVF